MTKIAKSYTFNGDLTSAIGILAAKLGQSKSQLVENTLRKDPEIGVILKQLHSMESMPDYEPKMKRESQVGIMPDFVPATKKEITA